MSNHLSNQAHQDINRFDVYIRPLPANIEQNDLRFLFSLCGPIQNVRIVRFESSFKENQIICYAFVKFTNENSKQKAKHYYNDKYLGLKKLTVNDAFPKNQALQRIPRQTHLIENKHQLSSSNKIAYSVNRSSFYQNQNTNRLKPHNFRENENNHKKNWDQNIGNSDKHQRKNPKRDAPTGQSGSRIFDNFKNQKSYEDRCSSNCSYKNMQPRKKTHLDINNSRSKNKYQNRSRSIQLKNEKYLFYKDSCKKKSYFKRFAEDNSRSFSRSNEDIGQRKKDTYCNGFESQYKKSRHFQNKAKLSTFSHDSLTEYEDNTTEKVIQY